MAEALGLAASVIAVVDLTGKAITLSVKLKSLWDEVKDVPTVLLEKAEELQDLDELLRDAEAQAYFNPGPSSAWNDAVMKKAIGKARAAMGDLQKTVDDLRDQVADRRRHRRKLAAARVVLQKESLDLMERKLDRALGLFKMAQVLYCAKMTTLCTSLIVQRLPDPLEPPANAVVGLPPAVETKDATGLEFSKAFLAREIVPDTTAILNGSTMLGRFHFGFGNNKYQFSVRTPSWLNGAVYSAMAQRSVMGWQFSLTAYPIIKNICNLEEAIASDDTTILQKSLHEMALTPYVHAQNGRNLMHVAVDSGAVEITKWLLSLGLRPGSFSEWTYSPILSYFRISSPLENLLWRFGTNTHDSVLEIMKLFLIYTPEMVGEFDHIWCLILLRISLRNFLDLQQVVAPEYHSFSLQARLWHAIIGLRINKWTWSDVLCLIPEAQTLTNEFLVSTGAFGTTSLCNIVADGAGYDLARPNDQRNQSPEDVDYLKILGDVVRMDPMSLEQTVDAYAAPRTPLSYFLRQVMFNMVSCSSWVADQILQSAISAWATTLYANGIDLMKYGRMEKGKNAEYLRRGRVPGWSHDVEIAKDGSSRVYYITIIGITYGQLPEHWRLWWALDDLDCVGEFWDAVEGPAINVPGSWVDDAAETEDTAENSLSIRWNLDGGLPPLIWSEYRQIKPPI